MEIAQPHFLALGLDMLPSAPANRDAPCRASPSVAWTVRDLERGQALEGLCDNVIFEGFRP